ncbi:hypothetical protein A2U01_0082025, partial [Trifolium medium]|nr:hypothetical protein [Trifolium medium]MCI60769.1 hypothetical protein [Trifolium medium]
MEVLIDEVAEWEGLVAADLAFANSGFD